MASRKRIKSIFKPLVIVVAAAYFVIDALTLSVLKPLLRKIVNLRLFALIVRWIASLSPYATLALFLIPLILLEPVKPLSAYLVASGQLKLGIFVLVVGEILKVTTVERIFHIGREKLLTIKEFALVYHFLWEWLNWVQALPSWQAVKDNFDGFIHWARKLNHDLAPEVFDSFPDIWAAYAPQKVMPLWPTSGHVQFKWNAR